MRYAMFPRFTTSNSDSSDRHVKPLVQFENFEITLSVMWYLAIHIVKWITLDRCLHQDTFSILDLPRVVRHRMWAYVWQRTKTIGLVENRRWSWSTWAQSLRNAWKGLRRGGLIKSRTTRWRRKVCRLSSQCRHCARSTKFSRKKQGCIGCYTRRSTWSNKLKSRCC